MSSPFQISTAMVEFSLTEAFYDKITMFLSTGKGAEGEFYDGYFNNG